MENFDPNAGKPMKFSAAKRWTAAYQAAEKERTGNPNPVKAHSFGINKINELLKGAQGLKIYPGYDPKGNVHMILVAIDAEGNDMTAQAIADPEVSSVELLQYSCLCPPCGCSNVENGL